MRFYKRIRHFLYIYALLFTLCFGVLTMAKYTGVAEETGTVSIAKWDVLANIPTEDINLVAGNNIDTYTLTVTSKSEVATNYSIVISNLPIGVQVALDNNNYKNVSSGKVQFNNVGSFNANASNTSKNHTLKIKAELYADEQTNKKIKVDVVFTQKKIN